jgi:hypothetical protein
MGLFFFFFLSKSCYGEKSTLYLQLLIMKIYRLGADSYDFFL